MIGTARRNRPRKSHSTFFRPLSFVAPERMLLVAGNCVGHTVGLLEGRSVRLIVGPLVGALEGMRTGWGRDAEGRDTNNHEGKEEKNNLSMSSECVLCWLFKKQSFNVIASVNLIDA